MTMENWNYILYNCFAYGSSKIVSIIYLVSWIFIGNYVLLNLFLAILLDSFTGDEETAELDELLEESKE